MMFPDNWFERDHFDEKVIMRKFLYIPKIYFLKMSFFY